MQKHVRSLNAQEILELVFKYLTELSALRDYDEVLEVLANMGRALTSADRCSVWVVSDDKKTIWTKVAHGIEPLTMSIDEGIVGYVVQTGEKVIIDNAYEDPRFNKEIDKQTGYKTKSMMVIPMYDNEDQIIGAFQVINHMGTKGVFDKRDLERLLLASTYAAETLVSAKLTQEIQDTQREVVFTMGAIGESRSKETGNHVKRVAEYSKILALALGMDEEEAELLKQASPMHDIGKVAIADEILKKPGRFTKAERKEMQRHAELGYEMIKDSPRPLLKTAAIVAYEHHERWDGKGYPRGLKGEEIHIYGRITALADVFDALGSDRIYKKAWDDEKIFQFIKEERGKQFDPFIVDKFFEHIDEILAVREKFCDKFQHEPQIKKKDTIKVLGAYGTKLKGFGTSSVLLNNANVIDAGNILETLEEFSTQLQTIWLSHSHLDHIVDIAYILDNYYNELTHPIVIAGLAETIQTIQEHFFNDKIWPDFSKIALAHDQKRMCIEYKVIEYGKTYTLSDYETLTPLQTKHSVASCGYIYKRNNKGIIISADTVSLENVVEYLKKDDSIKTVLIECSFPSSMEKLAQLSMHLTPQMIANSFNTIPRDDIVIYINHVKPIYLDEIVEEIDNLAIKFPIKIVNDKEIIEIL